MEEYKYLCDKCNYKCKLLSQLKKHNETELHKTGIRKIRSDKTENKKCEKCNYETRNSTTLKQHYLNIHGTLEEREKEFKYYCKLCNYGTFSIDLFKQHEESKKHKYIEFIKIL